MAASALLGALLGFGFGAACHVLSDQVQEGRHDGLRIELIADSRAVASGEGAFARAQFDDGATALVYVLFYDGEVRLNGERQIASGTFSQADWEKDGYLWQNGAIGRFRVETCKPEQTPAPMEPLLSIRRTAIQAIGSDDEAHALLQALVCGYRHDVSQSKAYADFQSCGLAHLVAVSGAHLVIVVTLLGAVLKALCVPRRISIAVLVAMMASYLVIAGVPVSAVRATIMSSVGLLALFGRRRPSALNALGLGAFIVVISSPPAAVSASFALSALSTTGIVLFAPLITHWLESARLFRIPLVADALALTLSANLLSLPLACSLFHQLPLIGLVANVACAPLFPVSCGAGLLAALSGAMSAPFCPALIGFSAMGSKCLLFVVDALSNAPYASIPVSIDPLCALCLSWLLAALLWITWPNMHLKAAVPAACAGLAVVLLMVTLANAEDAIIMLDVGQGDAILVRSKGQTLLVDTGNNDSQLLEQLGRCGAFKIGSVLVTHADDDHCGSLDALERAVDVDRVIMARGMLQSEVPKNVELVAQARKTASSIVELQLGDEFTVGRFKARVVGPARFTDGGNADSVCLLLEYDGDGDGEADFTSLLTGDAESNELDAMIQMGEFAAIDVYKVGHHGSQGAISADQAQLLHPSIALVGVGAHNRYGHPSPETIDTLESVGCRVYRTDRDGQVKCLFTCDSIEVRLQ